MRRPLEPHSCELLRPTVTIRCRGVDVDSGVGDTGSTTEKKDVSAAPGRYFSQNLPWMNQGEEAESERTVVSLGTVPRKRLKH
jgi:hypothetical protein